MKNNIEEILENQIYEFVKNRYSKEESTGSRHVHIRFDIEIVKAEKILYLLLEKNKISKFYDKEYQEERFIPEQIKKAVKV